jgi:hypothetical protein
MIIPLVKITECVGPLQREVGPVLDVLRYLNHAPEPPRSGSEPLF